MGNGPAFGRAPESRRTCRICRVLTPQPKAKDSVSLTASVMIASLLPRLGFAALTPARLQAASIADGPAFFGLRCAAFRTKKISQIFLNDSEAARPIEVDGMTPHQGKVICRPSSAHGSDWRHIGGSAAWKSADKEPCLPERIATQSVGKLTRRAKMNQKSNSYLVTSKQKIAAPNATGT